MPSVFLDGVDLCSGSSNVIGTLLAGDSELFGSGAEYLSDKSKLACKRYYINYVLIFIVFFIFLYILFFQE